MYNLDFETMKQVMQEHQKTGYLYADVSSGVAGMQEPCRIEVNLQAGIVVSCSITGSSGRRLTDKDSAKKIARLGRLKWTFTPQEGVTLSSKSGPLPELAPLFPQRTVHLEQWQLQSWPRMHRLVFALVDGTRSIDKIADVLSVSSDQVDKALRDLQSIGVVTLGSPNGRNYQNGR